jgi:hypothetical protein
MSGPPPDPVGVQTLSIAGLPLEVRADAGARRFLGAFDRVGGTPDRQPSVACLRLSSDPRSFDRPRYAGLEVGQYRLPRGAFVLHADEPRQIQGYWPSDSGEPGSGAEGGDELDLILSAPALTAGDLLAHPAHASLTAWLGSRSRYAVHAAGVALDGHGLLLVGEGGQGKTTTALAAIQRGFDYLGDDLCWLSFDEARDGQPQLHGLFATCKVNPDSRTRLGLDAWSPIGMTPRQKAVYRLPSEVRFRRTVPLAAMVLVSSTAGHGEAPSLTTARSMRAVAQTFAPFLRIMGPSGSGLSAMTELLRRVPLVRLPLSWHLDAVVDRLATIAATHGADG